MSATHYLLVFLGGGIGAAARHGVNRWAMHMWGPGFPAGTMIVNLTGSLAIGLLIGLFLALPSVNQPARLFIVTGVLGGFTTFSAFSLDALTLWQRGETTLWFIYVAASVLVSLAAAAVGLIVSRQFF